MIPPCNVPLIPLKTDQWFYRTFSRAPRLPDPSLLEKKLVDRPDLKIEHTQNSRIS